MAAARFILLALLTCVSAEQFVGVPSKSAGRKLKSNKASAAATAPVAMPVVPNMGTTKPKPKGMPKAPQSPIAMYFKSLPETTKSGLSNLMKEQRKVKDIADEAVKNSTRKSVNDKIKALLSTGYTEYRKARDATHPPTKKPSTPGMKPPMPAAGSAAPMAKKKKSMGAAVPPPAPMAAVPGAASKKKKKSPAAAVGL